jgi:RNA polymerase sigma-70 factor (ECF subfamily)
MPEFKADPEAGSFKSWLLTLTRWRIVDQARKRQVKPAPNPDGEQESSPNPQAGMPALRRDDDSARTSTVDRIPDPGMDLEAVWNEEWENNLLAAAAGRVKRQVDPEQFQLFDFHVLKQWPAKKVARKLGVNLSQVYFSKYKISKLMKKEIKKLDTKLA